METMHPTMVRGLSGYRRDATPPIELEHRMDAVRSWLRRESLDAVLVYGDPRQCSRLCYLTGMVPMSRWAAVLVPARGEPILLAAVSGSRDLPFMRTLSYVENVVAAEDLSEQIPALTGSSSRVALITETGIASGVYRALLSAGNVHDVAGTFLDALMRSPSDTELAHLRALTTLTQSVAEEITTAYRDGATPSTALIAGEKFAREQRAHDVRLLVSVDGGQTLQPFERPVDADPEVMVFYLGLEVAGYWSQVFRTAHRTPTADVATADVERRVAAAVEAIGASRPAAEVLAILQAPGAGLVAHELIDGRHIVRLGPWSQGDPVPGGDAPLSRGTYSVRASARSHSTGGIKSRTVEVGDEGVLILG